MSPFAILLAVVLILVGLNVACWLVFQAWPSLLLTENERLRYDYLARFEGELKPYIGEWFDLKPDEWPSFVAELQARIAAGGHVYEDFTVFKPVPSAGKFFNFLEAGHRAVRTDLQGPWPIDRSNFNIFMFGGSTTMGVGPDWTTIPSYLQQELAARGPGDRPVRVYNFGRGSYFLTQERILFQQLLLRGAVPDVAMFFDGVNDCFFFDGRTGAEGFLRQAFDDFNKKHLEATQNRVAARLKWRALAEFVGSLPLARAAQAIGEALARRNAPAAEVLYRPIPVEPGTIEPVIGRYLDNKRQIEGICREYGIRDFFVWQPTPAYKYDLACHVALSHHYGLGGHERSGVGYELMARRLSSEPPHDNFLWLADIQENEHKALYLDNMHYTSEFSHQIARHIAKALHERGYVPAAAAGII
ncbi:MAG: SGNH/GDSL hydrolase family protein [Alphaproteobacteria bacterium]|nr:SGNH/GDSL hydrolase family protein [Alphaproteobacteria bacterium]